MLWYCGMFECGHWQNEWHIVYIWKDITLEWQDGIERWTWLLTTLYWKQLYPRRFCEQLSCLIDPGTLNNRTWINIFYIFSNKKTHYQWYTFVTVVVTFFPFSLSITAIHFHTKSSTITIVNGKCATLQNKLSGVVTSIKCTVDDCWTASLGNTAAVEGQQSYYLSLTETIDFCCNSSLKQYYVTCLPLKNIFKIILMVQCLIIGWMVSLSQPLTALHTCFTTNFNT